MQEQSRVIQSLLWKAELVELEKWESIARHAGPDTNAISGKVDKQICMRASEISLTRLDATITFFLEVIHLFGLHFLGHPDDRGAPGGTAISQGRKARLIPCFALGDSCLSAVCVSDPALLEPRAT
jgi:hypothetical protein